MSIKKRKKKKQSKNTHRNPILTAMLWGLFVLTIVALTAWLYINNIGRWYIELAIFLCIWTVLFVLACRIFINRFRRWRYLSSTIGQIDQMDGREFERFLKSYFEEQGYKVSLTKDSHDYGADLICTNKEEVLVVQAKRYEANVGNAAVQQVVAAQAYYEADRCLVVTNSYFTKPAIELAETNEVELWDRDELMKLMRKK